MSTPKYTVRQATEADYPGAIAALTDAFKEDPVMSAVVGGKDQDRTDMISALFDFQIRTTYGPKGIIDIAVNDEGTIVGAALWISPEGQKGNLLTDIKGLPEYYKVLGSSLPKATAIELKLLASRPKFDHWYLYTIGVHKNARRQGVGGLLLDFRREQLGEYPAYLEASTFDSAALYARHGFVEMFKFKKKKEDEGLPELGMLHPAPISQIEIHGAKQSD